MEQQHLKHQVEGTAQTIVGRIARVFGRLFGSPKVQVEGAAEEMRGRANVQRGKVGERVEDATQRAEGKAEEAQDAAQHKAKEAMSNAEGGAKELEGKMRRAMHQR